MPVIAVLLIYIVGKIIMLIKAYFNKNVYVKTKDFDLSLIVQISFFIMMNIVYQTVTNLLLTLLKCKGYENTEYLMIDPHIKCWELSHIEKMLYSAGPFVILIGIGFPLLLFLKIMKQKKKGFNDVRFIQLHGYFIIGFKDHAFYWEIIY